MEVDQLHREPDARAGDTPFLFYKSLGLVEVIPVYENDVDD